MKKLHIILQWLAAMLCMYAKDDPKSIGIALKIQEVAKELDYLSEEEKHLVKRAQEILKYWCYPENIN